MVTEEDLALLDRFAEAGIMPDWVALSLISTPEDVVAGREKIDLHLGKPVRVMAKIETQAAVDRVESILAVADGTMVARGDLGPAVRFVGLPEAEARIVSVARRMGKPAVVATQILEYFAENGRAFAVGNLRAKPDRPREPRRHHAGQGDRVQPAADRVHPFAAEVLSHETQRLESQGRSSLRPLAACQGRAFLVAIEGPNGAGKTRLCGLLGQVVGAATLRGVPAGWEDSAAETAHDPRRRLAGIGHVLPLWRDRIIAPGGPRRGKAPSDGSVALVDPGGPLCPRPRPLGDIAPALRVGGRTAWRFPT